MLMLLVTAAALSSAPPAAPDDARLMEQARQQLERTATEYPSDSLAHQLLGRVDARAGRQQEALEQFQLAAAGGDLESLMLEAHELLDRDEYSRGLAKASEAVTECRKAGDTHREVDALLMVAYAKLELGRYGEALGECEHLLASPPRPLTGTDKARALSTIGGAQGLKAQREGIGALVTVGPKVKVTFEKAIAADPEHARAWYGLGRYYLEAPLFLNDRSKGERDLAKAAALDKHDLNIRAWYVWALHLRGKSGEEKAQLSAFERDFGSIPAARTLLAKLQAGQAPK